MRYFTRPSRERYEAEYIPREFAKIYQPHGAVTLRPEVAVDRDGTVLVEVAGQPLAIHPDAGAWAFLNHEELAVFRAIGRTPFPELRQSRPGVDEFVAHLYRRGLAGIDGRRAVDAAMFDDSPNYHEGHLVELLLTEKCNLACGYCLAGANQKMPAMTPVIARRAVDLAFAMSEAKVLAFEFSGGEPFLKFDLMRELVAYIQGHPARGARRVYLSVQTNGTLLDDSRVAWLKENDVRIGVSFDGQPWSQNVSRPMVNGGQSFSRLLRGIDLLQRHGVAFGALVVLNRSNVECVAELVDFLLDNGVTSFKLNPVSYLGTVRENWQDIGLEPAEVVRYFRELIDLLAARGYALLEANLLTMLDFLTSKQRTSRCHRVHCGAGDTFQVVSAAGDIYPCGRSTQSPAMRLGNIFDSGVTSLSEPARDNVQVIQIRDRRPRDFDDCASCPYRQFCQAGCSAQSFERYGTVRHKTPECTFFKTLYPHLMSVLSLNTGAFDAFKGIGYFGNDGVLVDENYCLGAPALAAADATA